ncbi:hypothetical protein GUJ93_ZPchr0012g20714 [Zizania palustris]|uniref:Uncharacterized protein n=1 Tax=Zizania palustris TaxID=103762 RepID=A0A8J6BTW8_ZIZPA|nr:hypothetical protein GUJ93_ZPchr0012g20714 [Zizania palustris]
MGQEEEEAAAAAAAATVVFSWEQGQGVSKQSPLAWQKPALTAAGARDDNMPARRHFVPPPPGRLPLTASRSFSKARAVRPEDDPFLAAYLACTRSGAGARKSVARAREAKGERRFTWPGLGLGGLSCKSSNGGVENSMVRIAKPPELHPRDA